MAKGSGQLDIKFVNMWRRGSWSEGYGRGDESPSYEICMATSLKGEFVVELFQCKIWER